ncbi:hypothetical protein SISSUDRAFT_1038015 [Sistotremastrum suecicum HHB10207 ss-3]|uniref:Uncharacterized protein n=1 Tax=Sistotremastrum suecicum HHB10207 ss-3 TaxID=1314776 RepID=A0A165XBS2_9AGAM|nr:hypothetical protein SISSUDRAFT_1038015 [Sistotremastrum suecicum HHB10207 ss-3]
MLALWDAGVTPAGRNQTSETFQDVYGDALNAMLEKMARFSQKTHHIAPHMREEIKRRLADVFKDQKEEGDDEEKDDRSDDEAEEAEVRASASRGKGKKSTSARHDSAKKTGAKHPKQPFGPRGASTKPKPKPKPKPSTAYVPHKRAGEDPDSGAEEGEEISWAGIAIDSTLPTGFMRWECEHKKEWTINLVIHRSTTKKQLRRLYSTQLQLMRGAGVFKIADLPVEKRWIDDLSPPHNTPTAPRSNQQTPNAGGRVDAPSSNGDPQPSSNSVGTPSVAPEPLSAPSGLPIIATNGGPTNPQGNPPVQIQSTSPATNSGPTPSTSQPPAPSGVVPLMTSPNAVITPNAVPPPNAATSPNVTTPHSDSATPAVSTPPTNITSPSNNAPPPPIATPPINTTPPTNNVPPPINTTSTNNAPPPTDTTPPTNNAPPPTDTTVKNATRSGNACFGF